MPQLPAAAHQAFKIGLSLHLKDEYGAAIPYYEKSLELCKASRLTSHWHLEVVKTLGMLSDCHLRLGDLDTAVTVNLRAFDTVMSLNQGSEAVMRAAVAHMCGKLLAKRGQVSEAIDGYRQALLLWRRTFDNAEGAADSLISVAGLYCETGQVSLGLEALDEPEDICRDSPKRLQSPNLLALAGEVRGDIFCGLSCHADALTNFDRVPEKYAVLLRRNGVRTMGVLPKLADCHRALGNAELAIGIYRQVLSAKKCSKLKMALQLQGPPQQEALALSL